MSGEKSSTDLKSTRFSFQSFKRSFKCFLSKLVTLVWPHGTTLLANQSVSQPSRHKAKCLSQQDLWCPHIFKPWEALQSCSQVFDLVSACWNSICALKWPEVDTPLSANHSGWTECKGSVAGASDDMIPKGGSNSCNLKELQSLEV